MPTFQVRNRRTKMCLGEVSVDDPEMVLDELAVSTGCTIEEIAHSLGSTIEEAKAALDIVVLKIPTGAGVPCDRNGKSALPARQLFAAEPFRPPG